MYVAVFISYPARRNLIKGGFETRWHARTLVEVNPAKNVEIVIQIKKKGNDKVTPNAMRKNKKVK